jgi:hypothetical protein
LGGATVRVHSEELARHKQLASPPPSAQKPNVRASAAWCLAALTDIHRRSRKCWWLALGLQQKEVSRREQNGPPESLTILSFALATNSLTESTLSADIQPTSPTKTCLSKNGAGRRKFGVLKPGFPCASQADYLITSCSSDSLRRSSLRTCGGLVIGSDAGESGSAQNFERHLNSRLLHGLQSGSIDQTNLPRGHEQLQDQRLSDVSLTRGPCSHDPQSALRIGDCDPQPTSFSPQP